MESFRHSSAKLRLVWVTLAMMSTALSYNCKERWHSSDYNISPLQYSEAHAQLYAYNHTVTYIKYERTHFYIIWHTCTLIIICHNWQHSDLFVGWLWEVTVVTSLHQYWTLNPTLISIKLLGNSTGTGGVEWLRRHSHSLKASLLIAILCIPRILHTQVYTM